MQNSETSQVSHCATKSPPYLGGHDALPSPASDILGGRVPPLLPPAGFTPLLRKACPGQKKTSPHIIQCQIDNDYTRPLLYNVMLQLHQPPKIL